MRIARFAADGDPQYGIVELAGDGGQFPDTVSVLTGDPIAMPVQLTGERKELDGVRLLAPVIPRSKWSGWGATMQPTPPRWATKCRSPR